MIWRTAIPWLLTAGIAATSCAIVVKEAHASSSRLANIALRYEGLHERKHYSRLKSLVGHSPTATPWCSTFTCAVVQKAGYRCPKGYYAARSFLKWGKKVSLSNIRRGDVVVFSRGRGKGHNGIFLGWHKGKMKVISGNSRNQVRIGYYSTKRLLGVRRAY